MVLNLVELAMPTLGLYSSAVVLIGATIVACGSKDSQSAAPAVQAGVSGASGGSVATTGGNLGTTGDATLTGGSVVTGGIATTGGAMSTGASVVTGGVPMTGGVAATGGAMSTGGANATGMGCGAATWPASGDYTLDVDGTTREYIVAIPDAYDPNTPYKLVFAWHGLGGTAQQIAGGTFSGGYYGLQTRSGGSTIFVAGQGLDTSNSVGSGPGWDNMGGRDVAFTSAMLAWFRANYCIDDARIFSVGMSYGGIMSNTVGCTLGEDFRAIAPMSGMGPSTFGGASCVGQVAAWISHGNMDTVVAFSSGQASRDYWASANHCATTTMPIGSNGCVAYDGCDAGYPVHWCEFDGGHTVPSFAADDIWAFFSQF